MVVSVLDPLGFSAQHRDFTAIALGIGRVIQRALRRPGFSPGVRWLWCNYSRANMILVSQVAVPRFTRIGGIPGHS
jgi:hypothetical protein